MSATEANAGGLWFGAHATGATCGHAHASEDTARACARKHGMGLAFAPSCDLPDFDRWAELRKTSTRRGAGIWEPCHEGVRYLSPNLRLVLWALDEIEALGGIACSPHDPVAVDRATGLARFVACTDRRHDRAYLLGGTREAFKVEALGAWVRGHPERVRPVERKRNYHGRLPRGIAQL